MIMICCFELFPVFRHICDVKRDPNETKQKGKFIYRRQWEGGQSPCFSGFIHVLTTYIKYVSFQVKIEKIKIWRRKDQGCKQIPGKRTWEQKDWDKRR